MNFGEAIQAMKDGKRVRRKDWENKWLAINNLKSGYPTLFISAKTIRLTNIQRGIRDKKICWQRIGK